MKKTFLILTIICVCCINFVQAQQKVALHSNGTTTIFGGSNPFTDAYNASANGDTIYLPGGNIPFPTTIDKGIVIIGAGFYPDSTTATNPTVSNAITLLIGENADNLYMEGFEVNGAINFASSANIDNVVLKRLRFKSMSYLGTGNLCENHIVRECVITGDVNLSNCKSSMISNCIIDGRILNGIEMGISNNLLLHNSAAFSLYTINNVDNSYFSNNILLKPNNSLVGSTELSTFEKNLYGYIPDVGSNTFVNNYEGVNLDSIFVNYNGLLFNYSENYQLVNPLLYTGTDGNEVGIYGGFFPYKTAAVPKNPHIQIKNIAPTTNANGDLQIQIQVRAQNE
ncbi:MAG: hypothetical protein QMD02_00410 [Bacteroidales bacterium]|nr:hypothetical protein [Bacteroidales bacterium]